MDMRAMVLMQSAVGVLNSAILIGALVLLWARSKSGWLLLSLAGTGMSVLFQLARAIVPGFTNGSSTLLLIWWIPSLMVSAGLLGYALDETNRRS